MKSLYTQMKARPKKKFIFFLQKKRQQTHTHNVKTIKGEINIYKVKNIAQLTMLGLTL